MGYFYLTICGHPPPSLPQKEPMVRFFDHMFQTILRRIFYLFIFFFVKKFFYWKGSFTPPHLPLGLRHWTPYASGLRTLA